MAISKRAGTAWSKLSQVGPAHWLHWRPRRQLLRPPPRRIMRVIRSACASAGGSKRRLAEPKQWPVCANCAIADCPRSAGNSPSHGRLHLARMPKLLGARMTLGGCSKAAIGTKNAATVNCIGKNHQKIGVVTHHNLRTRRLCAAWRNTSSHQAEKPLIEWRR